MREVFLTKDEKAVGPTCCTWTLQTKASKAPRDARPLTACSRSLQLLDLFIRFICSINGVSGCVSECSRRRHKVSLRLLDDDLLSWPTLRVQTLPETGRQREGGHVGLSKLCVPSAKL